MPLYKKKPLELVPPPTGVAPDTEVFQISFTGEVFLTYEYVAFFYYDARHASKAFGHSATVKSFTSF